MGTDGVAAYVSYAQPCTRNMDNPEECWAEAMGYYYESLPATLLSLWMAVSGGTDWLELYMPLREINESYALLLTLYVAFVILCVVNVKRCVSQLYFEPAFRD